jgi:DNA uptake protein ComE-like DNA-binding protein
MKIPVKHWLKQNLDFSKKDRNAVIILIILILLALAVNILLDYFPFGTRYDYSEYKRLLEEWQNQNKNKELQNTEESLFLFNPNTIPEQKLDSLMLPRFVKKNLLNYRNAGGKFSTSADVRKIYGMNDSIFEAVKNYIQIPPISKPSFVKEQSIEKSFSGFIDPNMAGRDELMQFGFTKFQAGNIVEYRKNGGRFEIPSDLLKIYGLDSAFYLKIESHIQIEATAELPVTKHEYEPPGIMVELNSTDSAGLMQLAGVGPVFASRILKYRDLLGGFNRIEQLLEVYNFTEETFRSIQNKITVDTTEVQKIRLNFATYAQLLRHPYLNDENVKSILDYRNQNGSYTSVRQIFDKGLVDSTTYYLIQPYLSSR